MPIARAQDSQPVGLPASHADTTSAEPSLTQLRDLGDVIASLLGRSHVQTEAEVKLKAGLSIVALPSVGYNPAYGVYAGIGASAGGWLGDPAVNKVSVFALNATYSASQQINVQFKSDAWFSLNRWNLKGDWRYLDTSQPTYGLGPIEVQPGSYPMEFRMWRLYQTVYRQVSGHWYIGAGYHLNIHEQIVDSRANQGEITPFTIYSGIGVTRTVASGLSANVLVDSRDNPIYARRGVYWNASIRSFTRAAGGDQDWQELESDLRVYPILPARSRNVLALWSRSWITFGHGPYLDLPAVGWDTYGRSGRGYVQGRLRSPSQIYNEAEYRVPLRRDELLGGVLFLNAMAGTLPSGNFGGFDPGVGLGLRVKFVKRTRTNLTIDYGWGNAGSNGLYLGTQEAF